MTLGQKAGAMEKGIRFVESGLNVIAGLMLLGMMFLGACDVVGRYLFNSPITGTLEISSILMGGMVFLAWAHTQAEGAHVSVDIFFMLYPPRVRAILSFVMMFLCLILFALIIWQSTSMAISDWQGGKLVRLILIPIAPFKFMISLGALFICLEFIIQMILLIPKILGREEI
ncbi:TRAP transporter small permease subunit [Thermodesulfobacteriota bacterium]